MNVEPIGFVRGGRTEPDDDSWGGSVCKLQLDISRFTGDALAGLDAFSHIEVLFIFDRVSDDEIVLSARHPRGRVDWPKVGIFAQRGKNRPNRIGITVCKLLRVFKTTVEVQGLDAIDGTPILDIKPVMREFLPREEIRQPQWADELMKDYW